MRPTWTERLDSGLDPMWDFLRFHPEKPTVRDIEVLENYLDDLRTLMVQKSAGQSGREAKTAGAIDFDDLEMTMNAIIIQTMWIYLAGGTKMLKEVLKRPNINTITTSAKPSGYVLTAAGTTPNRVTLSAKSAL